MYVNDFYSAYIIYKNMVNPNQIRKLSWCFRKQQRKDIMFYYIVSKIVKDFENDSVS